MQREVDSKVWPRLGDVAILLWRAKIADVEDFSFDWSNSSKQDQGSMAMSTEQKRSWHSGCAITSLCLKDN